MEILASCSYDESLNYDGRLIIENEEGEKPDKVSLNVVVGVDETIDLSALKPSVKSVTFLGSVDLSNVSSEKVKIFNEFSLDEFYALNEPEDVKYDGVTTLVRLPDGYCDMKKLYCLNNCFPFIRFIGGNLLNIDKVNIGRYEQGKEKSSPVYNGIYDQFLEMPLSEIGNLKDIVKKARKKLNNKSSEGKSKTPKEKKTSAKKTELSKSFNSLFSDAEEEF